MKPLFEATLSLSETFTQVSYYFSGVLPRPVDSDISRGNRQAEFNTELGLALVEHRNSHQGCPHRINIINCNPVFQSHTLYKEDGLHLNPQGAGKLAQVLNTPVMGTHQLRAPIIKGAAIFLNTVCGTSTMGKAPFIKNTRTSSTMRRCSMQFSGLRGPSAATGWKSFSTLGCLTPSALQPRRNTSTIFTAGPTSYGKNDI